LAPGIDPIDHAIYHLLNDRKEQRPWSVHEIEQEIGDPIAVADGIAHLRGAGLIHHCGDYIWISRAALRAEEMAL
jgi:hypothetical protein